MKKKKMSKISSQLNLRILIIILIIFLLTSVFSIVIQYKKALDDTNRLLVISVDDEIRDIEMNIDETQKLCIGIIKESIDNYSLSYDDLVNSNLYLENVFNEINIINKNGIVTHSSDKSLVGFDVRSKEESAKFFEELTENKEIVTPLRQSVNDPSAILKYSGVELKNGDYLQAGCREALIYEEISDAISIFSANRHVLEQGMIFIIDENNNIVSKRSDLSGNDLKNLLETRTIKGPKRELMTVSFNDETYYRVYDEICSYKVVAVLRRDEVLKNLNMSIFMTTVMGIVLFVTLYLSVSLLVKRKVVRQINTIAHTLETITHGDLDAQVSVYSSAEFSVISKGINTTVASLKDHIAREAARIDNELCYAREIQHCSLPSLSEQFRANSRFGLYAYMDTAKEVGGDFYDFYMKSKNTLAFVIADVSGKGIPAAMFMMNGKATLHDSIMRSKDMGKNITYANRRICEGNEAGMFITSWSGTLDIKTGKVRFVNAGHNPPVLIRDKKAGFVNMEADLVLGLMDDEEYSTQRLQLEKGDILYLYTDGVTEAANKDNILYGEKRLIDTLSGISPNTGDIDDICKDVCQKVKESLDSFVNGAAQSDDITMLCIYYR